MEVTPSAEPLEEAHAIAQPSAKASTPPPVLDLYSLPAAQQHEASVPSTSSSSAGFRKFRELLMAKKFENHDNLPVKRSIFALATGGKVLVHCFMGRSRSATIILAYLVSRRGLALSEALRELRRVRPQAQPNTGFYKELLALEAQQKEQQEV
ncbi:hypothetical protein BBJ28_00010968 [Nothophytophthora sp. Chile5]|nr:hypothetical protein BBJ28_00010968 [Nothophytophthora sp. Chile5]